MPRLFVGMAGGSGACYGRRLVRALVELGWGVDLCISRAAFQVLRYEEGLELDPQAPDLARLFGPLPEDRVRFYANERVDAPAASGSALRRGAVIAPCSMGTLARISWGFSSCLLERVADVALKEGCPLVLVPREAPCSALHLENMLRLARAGAILLPASPGFYHRPRTIEDLVDHVVGKVLDRLRIEHQLFRRWGGSDPEPAEEDPRG
jgi:4-hydroxy-3-polyprenylbenzoate decarboxylase